MKEKDQTIAEKVRAYNAQKKIKEATGLDKIDETSMTSLAVGAHKNDDKTWTVVVLKYDAKTGVGMIEHTKVVDDKSSAAEQFKIFSSDRLPMFNVD